MKYLEARTAKEWGIKPTEWVREPRWSRATMVAQGEVEAKISFWMVEDRRRS